MSPAGVAQSDEGAPGPGEARLLASGALLQGIAQAAGLLALLAIVTILARDLTVPQLGAYGLTATLAGYLLVLRNSVASAAVRAMAGATDPGERSRVFAAAARLYAAVGFGTGLLIALAGVLIAGLILDGELASDARAGALGLAGLSAVGIASTVYLDAMRAERLFVRAARIEIVSVALQLALMLGLIAADASLSLLIAASGALPLFSGLMCAAAVRRAGLPFHLGRGAPGRTRAIVPTAGWLLVIELCNLAMYASGRVILGAYKTPAAVGRFEGPVRAHNLLYALGGALAVPVVPTASRYVASGDERRLRELVVRGTRYTLAVFVPVCVTLIVLAEPILEVWLGDRYGGGGSALAILVSYWLLYGGLVVTPGFLVGAGRARQAAQIMLGIAAANLVLALVLTPELGVDGPAIATAAPFAAAFPLMLRLGLSASGASLGELAREAWLPAYALGAVLAGALLGIRAAADPSTLPAVLGLAAGGALAYWAAFWALVLRPGERELARGLIRRRG